MTGYGNAQPARGGPGGSSGRADSGRTTGRGPGPGLVRGVVFSAMAASWAIVAMGAIGALGVHLLGLDQNANLGSVTAVLVSMAVGGKVNPTGDVSVFGLDAAAAQGAIDILPLGLTVVGALVLGWLFTAQLRRIAAPTPADLLARAAGAVVAFLVLLTVVAWAGDGSVALNLGGGGGGSSGGTTGGTTGGSSGGSGGSDGGIGGALGGLLGNSAHSGVHAGGGSGGSGGGDGGLGGLFGGLVGNSQQTVGFKVDLLPTLGFGLLWVVLVLAFACVAARRVPLPTAWSGLTRTVRPVASAITTIYLGTVAVGTVAGVIVGLTGNGGAKTIGGALLAAPNGIFLAIALGMGIPLNGQARGPLAHFLPSPVNQLLAGGEGKTITVSSLASLDGRVWLLPVGVVLTLFAVGVYAAVRTPRPLTGVPGSVGTESVGSESVGSEVGGAALRLGVGLAVVTPVLLMLADVSVNANLSVFGFDAAGAGLSVTGNVLLAVVLGLVEGAVFGAAGAALVRRFASAKRVAAEGGGAEGGGAVAGYPAGPGYPAAPPAPSAPPMPAPPSPGPRGGYGGGYGSGHGGGYGGLPQSAPPAQAPPQSGGNPYASPNPGPAGPPPAPGHPPRPAPGGNPYGGLPQQGPGPAGPQQQPPSENPYR
ncbi:streptophobe family protein [Streptacidiphilus sp. BW17]|uniref:streptophobe family protein n=1 Tax=Streptacidiphilus sp. BW17 TaxID=3156274 RepID=UPI003516B873